MVPQFSGRLLDSAVADCDEEVCRYVMDIPDEGERYFVNWMFHQIICQPEPLTKTPPRQPLDMLFLAACFREIYREREFLAAAAERALKFPDV